MSKINFNQEITKSKDVSYSNEKKIKKHMILSLVHEWFNRIS